MDQGQFSVVSHDAILLGNRNLWLESIFSPEARHLMAHPFAGTLRQQLFGFVFLLLGTSFSLLQFFRGPSPHKQPGHSHSWGSANSFSFAFPVSLLPSSSISSLLSCPHTCPVLLSPHLPFLLISWLSIGNNRQ